MPPHYDEKRKYAKLDLLSYFESERNELTSDARACMQLRARTLFSFSLLHRYNQNQFVYTAQRVYCALRKPEYLLLALLLR